MKKTVSILIALFMLGAFAAGCSPAVNEPESPISSDAPASPAPVDPIAPPADGGNLLPYDPLRDEKGETVYFELVEIDEATGKTTYSYRDYHYIVQNADGMFTVSKRFEGFGKIDILLQGEGLCTLYDIKGTSLVYSVGETFYTMTTDGESIAEVCTISGYNGEPAPDWYGRHISVTREYLYYLDPNTAKLYKYSLSGGDTKAEVSPLALKNEKFADCFTMLALVDNAYAYVVNCVENKDNPLEDYTPVNISRFSLESGECDFLIDGRPVNVRANDIYVLSPIFSGDKTLGDGQYSGFTFVLLSKGEQKVLYEHSFMQAVDYIVTTRTPSAATVTAGVFATENSEKAFTETVRLNYDGMTVR